MAASEAPIDRQFLALAEDLQRFAHGLLDISRGGNGSDSGIIFTDKAKLGAFFVETQAPELLQSIVQQIDELKMDPAKQAAAMVAIRKEKMGNSAAQREALLTTILHKVVELEMDKVKHAAAILKEMMVEPGKVAGKIRKERMDDKTPVKRGKVATTSLCAESDPPSAKHRLSDEYVRFILAMPRENPDDVVPYYDQCPILVEVMGEEWLAERKRYHEETAASTRRSHDEFVQFQTWVLKEWLDKGYVEVDQEFIDNANDLDKYSRELWEERGPPDVKFADHDDTLYTDDEEYVPYDPVEQARLLLSSLIESN